MAKHLIRKKNPWHLRFRRLRTSKKMTQREVAEALGYTQAYISQLETKPGAVSEKRQRELMRELRAL